MDHIRARFIDGALVYPSKCLNSIKPYFIYENYEYYDNIDQNIKFKGGQHINLKDKHLTFHATENHIQKKVISGITHIDDLINQIIHYIIRDYIEIWFYYISDDLYFINEIQQCMSYALAKICQQLKCINFTPYITKNLVEDFVNHIKIYKHTIRKLLKIQRNNTITKINENLNIPSNNPIVDYNNYKYHEDDHNTQIPNGSIKTNISKLKSKEINRMKYPPTSIPHYICDMYNDVRDIEKQYFEIEAEFESFTKCHDDVCLDPKQKNAFLNVFAQIVLYILVPAEEFTRAIKNLLTEILVNSVLIPVIELFSDPDYINQTIIWLCSQYSITNDNFLEVVKVLDNVRELEAIKEIVGQEIASERSKDTGGIDDAEVKQRLQSLTYLKRLIDSRIKRMVQGTSYSELSNKFKALSPDQSEQLKNIKLSFILDHTLSLDYFLNYLNTINCQNYMYFYLTIESFRSLARQHISIENGGGLSMSSVTHQNTANQPICIKLVRNEAQKIFDQYLIDKAPHLIKLNPVYIKVLRAKLKNEIPNATWFDDLQFEVLDIFIKEDNGIFENFKKSDFFYKLLAEMDMLPETKDTSETSSLHEYPVSHFSPTISSHPSDKSAFSNYGFRSASAQNLISKYDMTTTSSYPPSSTLIPKSKHLHDNNSQIHPNILKRALELEYKINAHVTHIVVSRESDKTYAMYAITITRQPYQMSDDARQKCMKANKDKTKTGTNDDKQLYSGFDNKVDTWCVYRRYSEFHDFHMNLRDRYSDVDELRFPPKKPFGNMTKDFLEKRLKMLDSYLKVLMSPEFVRTHKGLKELLDQFLESGPYEKWNGQIARKMDTFVNPLKSSVRFMGSVVKTVPENIADGVIKVSDTMKDGVEKFINLTQFIPGFKMLNEEHSLTSNYTINKASLTDMEDEENITFKILILLMDEIFDLKTRNQWLRHRLMVILRQVFQVTYGGTMNKKMLEQIDYLTSTEQVAHYLKKFRDSFWPNGVWAGPQFVRSDAVKARTKVLALSKIFAAIPDEIKTLVGSETTKDGIKMTFDMFQVKSFNRRFLFVILESLCPLIFAGGLGHRMIKIMSQKYLTRTRKDSNFDAHDDNKSHKLPNVTTNKEALFKNKSTSNFQSSDSVVNGSTIYKRDTNYPLHLSSSTQLRNSNNDYFQHSAKSNSLPIHAKDIANNFAEFAELCENKTSDSFSHNEYVKNDNDKMEYIGSNHTNAKSSNSIQQICDVLPNNFNQPKYVVHKTLAVTNESEVKKHKRNLSTPLSKTVINLK
ncbi:sorting nexin-13-like [Gordionus sp. m RMFG-2023]|uniref:sorting nexin-13-like n=1 Tax=Gordionus sp. m RMFG-2023 TaxID=3053472 RepID=UPI0031FBB82D